MVEAHAEAEEQKKLVEQERQDAQEAYTRRLAEQARAQEPTDEEDSDIYEHGLEEEEALQSSHRRL